MTRRMQKILVIEDSNIIRMEVKLILEKHGFTVLELNNAEDLLKHIWRYYDVDLLILDITLPGMDGLTALQQLQHDQHFAYIPVIILTGLSDRDTVRRAIAAGAVNYIKKPFAREELLERVQHALGISPLEQNQPPLAIEDVVRLEINRARRAKTKITLLGLYLPPKLRSIDNSPQLFAAKDTIKSLIREIDSVFLTEQRNLLLILPFTGVEGITVVLDKLKSQLPMLKDEGILTVSATYPDDGETVHDLLNVLEKKRSSASNTSLPD
ncbi:response regulator receiver protein [Thermosinus carboxydivorans Nor1]|uniref:Response regulator receiver protein n=1 Tax=Thermosinus carboxydivorans Nor1 TaxID=401526 RepID=A1HNS6_9FIRM|nr:response regulator [Thermosinus carboxydivorans]EAX48428.1 response regulator receiver protein [Thermosinus carboxydivorans Nor1]